MTLIVTAMEHLCVEGKYTRLARSAPSPLRGEGWGEGGPTLNRRSSPPHPNPCMGLSLSSTKLPHAPLSFRAFCDGGGNATLGVPAKRKRALLRSNLPRNSRPETNCDATGAGEQPLVGVCVDHLNFASSCWHH